MAVLLFLSDLITVKTGSGSPSHWSLVHVRRNGWLRLCSPVSIMTLTLATAAEIGATVIPTHWERARARRGRRRDLSDEINQDFLKGVTRQPGCLHGVVGTRRPCCACPAVAWGRVYCTDLAHTRGAGAPTSGTCHQARPPSVRHLRILPLPSAPNARPPGVARPPPRCHARRRAAAAVDAAASTPPLPFARTFSSFPAYHAALFTRHGDAGARRRHDGVDPL